jgi:hypothetical protein
VNLEWLRIRLADEDSEKFRIGLPGLGISKWLLTLVSKIGLTKSQPGAFSFFHLGIGTKSLSASGSPARGRGRGVPLVPGGRATRCFVRCSCFLEILGDDMAADVVAREEKEM